MAKTFQRTIKQEPPLRMFSQRHYIEIAHQLCVIRHDLHLRGVTEVLPYRDWAERVMSIVIAHLGDLFAQDSPAFKRNLFDLAAWQNAAELYREQTTSILHESVGHVETDNACNSSKDVHGAVARKRRSSRPSKSTGQDSRATARPKQRQRTRSAAVYCGSKNRPTKTAKGELNGDPNTGC